MGFKKNISPRFDVGGVTVHSPFEEAIARQLWGAGITVHYEPLNIPYTRPAVNYKPDFLLPNGIIIETKGWFVSADRSKHKAIRKQHPDLDIRFVFSRSKSKIGKKSETTYGMWCERLGIPYADKLIPLEWLREPFDKKRWEAAQQFLIKKEKE